ncbi:CidA/LrgA family protein [Pradoshia eiseniae]|nr:CidA/LrgA family protein [Pradoshia eiseniae]
MTIRGYPIPFRTAAMNNQTMKMFKILIQTALLFIFYYIGVWLQETLNLLIPGSVIGMILLFLLLVFRILPQKWVDEGSAFLTGILPLLFVPVCVGIMKYANLFSVEGGIIVFVILISTLMTLAITGGVSQFAARVLTNRRLGE